MTEYRRLNLLGTIIDKIVVLLDCQVVAPVRNLDIAAKVSDVLDSASQLVLDLENAVLQCADVVVGSKNDLVVLDHHVHFLGRMKHVQDVAWGARLL